MNTKPLARPDALTILWRVIVSLLMLLVGAAAAVLFLTGCAIATAPRTKTLTVTVTTNNVTTTEEREAKGSAFIAWGDAKAVAEKIRVSNGKTQSIGMTGVDSESSATNVAPIIGSAGSLIGEAARKFLGAP